MKLAGTGASEAHAKELLDKVDQAIDTINESVLWRFDFEIWVSPDGSDDAAGTELDPVKTLYEASLRMPLFGVTKVNLKAGVHEMMDLTTPEFLGAEAKALFSCFGSNVIDGEVVDVEGITVSSVTRNEITAQGSPGWTPGQWKRHFLDFGTLWGFRYRFPIVDNSEDTIIIGTKLDNMPNGYIPTPVNGQEMMIQKNGAIVIQNEDHPAELVNALFLQGKHLVRNVDFDASVNRGYISMISSQLQAELSFWSCCFIGYDRENYGVGLSPGSTADFFACYGEDCYNICFSTRGNLTVSDCVAEECLVGWNCVGGSLFTSSSMFTTGTYALFAIKEGATHEDYCDYIWSQRSGFYASSMRYLQSDSFSCHEKKFSPLKGWTDSIHDTLRTVLTTISGSCHYVMRDSANVTLLADSDQFFHMDAFSGYVTMTEYKNGTHGKSLGPYLWADERGNRIYEN